MKFWGHCGMSVADRIKNRAENPVHHAAVSRYRNGAHRANPTQNPNW